MAKTCLQLKRSLIGYVVQLCLAGAVISICAITLSGWLTLLATLVMMLSYLHFFYQDRVVQLEYLADGQWTLLTQKQNIKTDTIQKIIDHGVYVVIFFVKHQPLVIWSDQLVAADWKRVKVLAKLY
mgnify:FL=1